MSFETKSVNEKNDAIVNLNSALNKAESNERIANISIALNTIIENGKFLNSSDDKEVELVNAMDEDIKSLVDKLIPGIIDKTTGKDVNEVLKNNLIQALKKTREELKKVKDEKTVEQNTGDKETTAVSTELATDVMSGKGIYTSEQLKALKGKSWKELWTDPIYIKTIQQFIVDTGAKINTISDKLLTNGIYGAGTIAGIKTIQNYLNIQYKSNLGTPDGLIGPDTLQELLKPVSDTDTRTRRDKMISDHKSGVLKLTPVDLKNNKKTEVKSLNEKGIKSYENLKEAGVFIDSNGDGMSWNTEYSNKDLKVFIAPNLDRIPKNIQEGTMVQVILGKRTFYFFPGDRLVYEVQGRTLITKGEREKLKSDGTWIKNIKETQKEKIYISKEKINEDIFQNILNKLRVINKEKKLIFGFNSYLNPYISISFSIDGKTIQKKININEYYKNNNFDYEKIIRELQEYQEKEKKSYNSKKAIEKEIKQKVADKKFTKEQLFGNRSNALIDTFFNKTANNNILSIDRYGNNYTRLSLDGKNIVIGFDMNGIDSSNDRLIIPLKNILTPNTTNINYNRLKASIRIYLEQRINKKYKS